MINTINLPPFKKMCVTIGNLPSSFMESMTYYEALCWLYDYFEKTLLPAINTNSEAITELQTAFTTLKAYIDNYFDNLDVQTEINNKLDAMAEGGELEEIIAAYLGSAGLLSFNTLNDMKGAENLIEGSSIRMLGKVTYNDGLGAFYKVRTLINSDVIDNDNLVALTNYPTLVAEKLPDAKINSLDSRVGDLEDANTKYFVIFGDSWSDFDGGFENWYTATNIGDVLNCELINYANGGAGFLVSDNLISTQITAAGNELTSFQKTHTKYVVIEGGVNDITATDFDATKRTNWVNAITNAISSAHTIFPNAIIVYAPNMCSPDLDENRCANCILETRLYTTNHLPYRSSNVKSPKNLPFFWLSHSAHDVYKTDNLHLNVNGAKAYGKEILNCLTGSEVDMVYNYKCTNVNTFEVLLNSNGFMELHGVYTSSGTDLVTIDSNSIIGEFIVINKKLMPRRFYMGSDGNAETFAWVNYLGGTNRELKVKCPRVGTFYF